jgi:glycosyltransferase involved in cell wall biosynthesis
MELRDLARAPRKAQLLVFDAGSLQPELNRMAARLGFGQRVGFEGFCPKVARWMQVADGFVLSSRHEDSPMVSFEAGA